MNPMQKTDLSAVLSDLLSELVNGPPRGGSAFMLNSGTRDCCDRWQSCPRRTRRNRSTAGRRLPRTRGTFNTGCR